MSRGGRRPRIAFLLDIPPGDSSLMSAVTTEVVALLRKAGDIVDLLVPEREVLDLSSLRPDHDLYVLKEKSPLNLSLAGALEIVGATVVNSFHASSLARDKVAATMALAGAGIPVPPSWAAGRSSLFDPLLADGPLWLKAARGSQGIGVRRVSTRADLGDEAPLDPYGLPLPLLAQREMPADGTDLKVYVVGDDVRAIRRIFPARTLEEKQGTPVDPPGPARDAALATGRVLGLEIYGVDFAVCGDRLAVIDVNALPGFKGVPDGPSTLARYFHHRAASLANGGSA